AITITLAVLLRLNKVLAFAFSNISFAPVIPIIIYFSLLVGGIVYPSNVILQLDGISLEAVQTHLWQYLIGSILLARVVALLIRRSSDFLVQRQLHSLPAD